ncbi:Polycomb complex protein BMI-1 [Frankliniella fusca]|uniref:Polycomb complex protein BMI-1 n=1 Tax=Frankliniella fusca TaxID=407009 RepID=A0AAE1L7A2_9NEOP|nr:Polycomb complex protein BMI-1 [Frankliniella fusca]
MKNVDTEQPGPRRLRVSELHPHLMCILCGGYYVDATTIIECLHSFCKSCLVRYLESNKYCPICEVQVHKTKPLLNIRPDETLQTMVYKLVPGLFHREMRYRQEFYAQHPEAPPSSPEDRGIVDPIECQYYSPDEPVSLALEFKTDNINNNGVYKRYLRCPAAVTVAHLQKLVRNKYGLSSMHHVDVLFDDKLLTPDYSIMDVAYTFQRKRKEQFHFTYRILENQCKRRKLDEASSLVDAEEPMDVDPPLPSLPISGTIQPLQQVKPMGAPQTDNKSKLDSIISKISAKKTGGVVKEKSGDEWKEVQLQISESGVMSVTDISSINKLINSIEKNVGPSDLKEMKPSVRKEPFNEKIRSETDKSSVWSVAAQDVKMVPPPSIVQSKVSKNLEQSKESKNLQESVKSDVHLSKPCEFVKSEKKEEFPLPKSIMDVKKDGGKETKPDSSEAKLTLSPVQAKPPVASLKTQSNIPSPKVPVPIVTSSSAQSIPSPMFSSTSSTTTSVFSSSSQSCSKSSIVSVSAPAATTPKLCTVTLGSSQVTLSLSPSPSMNCNSSLGSASGPVSKPAISTTTTTVTRGSPVSVPKTAPPSTSLKKSSSSPVGYKTLKCGPKNWNPTISRNSFLSSKADHQIPQQGSSTNAGNSQSSSSKPTAAPRFFKMRNTPRYLGNPASGVKAMYQIPDNKPETPPPAKSPSVMKLDPRTLSPIVSNSSSPTSKTSPVQPKARPPFPSTTLSAQVSNSHMPSSRSVTTTTTTSSSATKLPDLSNLRNSPTQVMVNPFLPNAFMSKNLPNFLFNMTPGLLPSSAQFGMMRPGLGYPPATVSGFHSSLPQSAGMLFNPHQLHRQLSASSPGSPTGYPSSLPSSPSMSLSPSSSSTSSSSSSKSYSAGQRIPINNEKLTNASSSQSSPNRTNRTSSSVCDAPVSNSKVKEPAKVNGSEAVKNTLENSSKPITSKSQEEKQEVKSKGLSSPVTKDEKPPTSSTSDNNNTLSISKTKTAPEKSDSGKLQHDISSLLTKEAGKCGNEELACRSNPQSSTSFQAQQS